MKYYHDRKTNVLSLNKEFRMRLNPTVFSVVLSLVLTLALTGEARADKSYRVESVSIAADLNPDGSMMVTPHRLRCHGKRPGVQLVRQRRSGHVQDHFQKQ